MSNAPARLLGLTICLVVIPVYAETVMEDSTADGTRSRERSGLLG